MGNLELNTDAESPIRKTFFVDVLLPVPIPKLYTYRVPYDLNDHVGVGYRVIVQFGSKNIVTGIILKVHEQPPLVYEAKYIVDLLEDEPFVNDFQIALIQWMSGYYMCTMGEVLNAALPSGLKLSSESKIQLHPMFISGSIEEEWSEQEQQLLEVLERESMLSYTEVGKILNIKSYTRIIKSLIDKGAILIFEEVKDRYKPKVESYLRLQDSYARVGKPLEHLMESLEKRPSQQSVLLAYLKHVAVYRDPDLNDKGLSKKVLVKEGLSRSSINTLVKNGVFEQFEKIISRLPDLDADQSSALTLTEAQEDAKKAIEMHFAEERTVLLHGITGSGKTEIYIEFIREIIAEGGQVLYLLPEIALTTQIVSRLKIFFGNAMGVYHSKYSDNERVEVWKGLLDQHFQLIVGVRSAIFLPFSDLKLIIVDEEHETSYKQFDVAPRYQARDCAQVLGQIHHCHVLLGSATPSMESLYLAKKGKYGYVTLTERYGSAGLPEIIFADLTQERKRKTMHEDFSSLLVQSISEKLIRDEQVILFQNRRGYAPFITCEACGWIPKCQNCAVSLTYHMYSNQLRCHYCGHSERPSAVCPACGSTRLKNVGFGTEKLEEDLKLIFKDARIRRMDLDTTRSKYSYQRILNDFEHREIDILVGTQMVSKGLDFDWVSLVGIFDIDRMLHFPDFRSVERTVQLAIQVSGRAGRRGRSGTVILQTRNLNQSVLGIISRHDYAEFYEGEIVERQRFHYPPFFRLIKITLKHRDKAIVEEAARAYGTQLTKALVHHEVLGPHEPMIGRIRNKYLMEFVVKIKRETGGLRQMKELIEKTSSGFASIQKFKSVQIVYDVDPY